MANTDMVDANMGWKMRTRAGGCEYGKMDITGLPVPIARKSQAIDKGKDGECDGGSD